MNVLLVKLASLVIRFPFCIRLKLKYEAISEDLVIIYSLGHHASLGS